MRKWTAAAAIVAAAAVTPAVGFAGQPVVREHGSFTDGPYATSFCGVAGSEIDSGTFTFRLDASGAFHVTGTFNGVFTADATGKSLELSSANLDKGNVLVNADGTATLTEKSAGLVLKFSIPNGPVLKDADGKPLIGAGVIDTVATFDIATGDLLSIEETWHGPHPLRDGVDICGPVIAYLTS